MHRVLGRVAAAFMLFGAAMAYAEPSLIQLRTELVSAWLVTVDGEDRTRTLKISGVEQSDAGIFPLDAVYGWSDGNQTAVRAEINQAGQERTLLLTTQPGSKIAATQKPDGTFVGTFTSTSGQTKGLKIERLSEAGLLKAKSGIAASSIPEISPPGPDVPRECAAWSGGWTGQWQAAGYRNTSRLWVRSVDKDCNASIASTGPMEWKMHNVKGGSISDVFCNRETGGYCRFEMSSDFSKLSANYGNAAGGHNWAEFTKINLK